MTWYLMDQNAEHTGAFRTGRGSVRWEIHRLSWDAEESSAGPIENRIM